MRLLRSINIAGSADRLQLSPTRTLVQKYKYWRQPCAENRISMIKYARLALVFYYFGTWFATGRQEPKSQAERTTRAARLSPSVIKNHNSASQQQNLE
jgi:hypothetical protein